MWRGSLLYRPPGRVKMQVDKEKENAKQRYWARAEFDAALRYITTHKLSKEDEMKVLEKLALLKLHLQNMGEEF